MSGKQTPSSEPFDALEDEFLSERERDSWNDTENIYDENRIHFDRLPNGFGTISVSI